jgi:hypothetical protein
LERRSNIIMFQKLYIFAYHYAACKHSDQEVWIEKKLFWFLCFVQNLHSMCFKSLLFNGRWKIYRRKKIVMIFTPKNLRSVATAILKFNYCCHSDPLIFFYSEGKKTDDFMCVVFFYCVLFSNSLLKPEGFFIL